MPLSGILRTWDDARGFGFVAPTQGGRELFIHISAFPRDGSRPTVGAALLYETEIASDGRLQAVRVRRKALGDPSTYPHDSRVRGERRRSSLVPLMALVLAIALGAFGYSRFQRALPPQLQPEATAVEGATTQPSISAPLSTPTLPRFTCDGRTHCSQMTSCSEAKFFLANCPGTQMDGGGGRGRRGRGGGDGIPCEQQWCTHPGAQ
jgi:cold shock CspA family protein